MRKHGRNPTSKQRCKCAIQNSSLGYVYDDSPNALWEAVKSKGGTLRAWIDHGSGKFVAECRLGSPMSEPKLAKADTMPEALEVCTYRACRAEEGEE